MKLHFHAFLFFFVIVVVACRKEKEIIVEPLFQPLPIPDSKVATEWANITLKTMDKATNNSPVYASRALALMGLTMYETVVQADTTYKSLSGQLSGFRLKTKVLPKTKYNWNLALNAAQAYMLKSIYYNIPESKLFVIDSLKTAIHNAESASLDSSIVSNSEAFGLRIASEIFDWSKSDGGYLALGKNFDPTYQFPRTEFSWSPPSAGQVVSLYPLQPHWGKNRRFVPANALLPIPNFMEPSRDRNSDYYKNYSEIYSLVRNLTQEQREIAAWWVDDPTETWSPPGHSYYTALSVVKKEQITVLKAAQTFAAVGLAVADAFMNCWATKYKYHSQRPNSYIWTTIDGFFPGFWPEPPFPSFYSGHSTQSMAAAVVLENLYGVSYSFTDTAHEQRKLDPVRNILLKPRSFTSFRKMAEEAGMSRLYGGIHIRMDNEIGLQEGEKVAKNVIALKWRK
jgi:hypothetical protein